MIHRFGLRSGSAGIGKWHGGEGVHREIEFLEPMQVSILSEVSRSYLFDQQLAKEGSRYFIEKDKTTIWHGRWGSGRNGKKHLDQKITSGRR